MIDAISGYIDPGTASAVAAMIISAIIGFGVYVRLYWEKIKLKFSRSWNLVLTNLVLIVVM